MTTPDIKRREWWVDESKKTLASNRYHRLLDKEQLANEKDWDANWFVNPKPDYIHVVEISPTEVIVDRELVEQMRLLLDAFLSTKHPTLGDHERFIIAAVPIIAKLEEALKT